MSADGSIELPFGDGRHLFRLAIGEWRELAELRKLGPRRLYDRVRTGDWFVDDLYHVIRMALIGGGMAKTDALRLTETYFGEWLRGKGLYSAEGLVIVIMGAALAGMETEPVGKAEADEAPTTSASSAPTETPGQPVAGRRKKSTA